MYNLNITNSLTFQGASNLKKVNNLKQHLPTTDLKKATEMLLEDLNGVFYSNAPVLDKVAIEKKTFRTSGQNFWKPKKIRLIKVNKIICSKIIIWII